MRRIVFAAMMAAFLLFAAAGRAGEAKKAADTETILTQYDLPCAKFATAAFDDAPVHRSIEELYEDIRLALRPGEAAWTRRLEKFRGNAICFYCPLDDIEEREDGSRLVRFSIRITAPAWYGRWEGDTTGIWYEISFEYWGEEELLFSTPYLVSGILSQAKFRPFGQKTPPLDKRFHGSVTYLTLKDATITPLDLDDRHTYQNPDARKNNARLDDVLEQTPPAFPWVKSASTSVWLRLNGKRQNVSRKDYDKETAKWRANMDAAAARIVADELVWQYRQTKVETIPPPPADSTASQTTHPDEALLMEEFGEQDASDDDAEEAAPEWDN